MASRKAQKFITGDDDCAIYDWHAALAFEDLSLESHTASIQNEESTATSELSDYDPSDYRFELSDDFKSQQLPIELVENTLHMQEEKTDACILLEAQKLRKFIIENRISTINTPPSKIHFLNFIIEGVRVTLKYEPCRVNSIWEKREVIYEDMESLHGDGINIKVRRFKLTDGEWVEI